jgi:hypothetical protein
MKQLLKTENDFVRKKHHMLSIERQKWRSKFQNNKKLSETEEYKAAKKVLLLHLFICTCASL